PVQAQAPVEAPKTPQDMVMQILINDAAERALAAEVQRENNRRKAKARAAGAGDTAAEASFAILKCSHTKGGKLKRKNAAPDASLYMHTFPNRARRIKCQICPLAVWSARPNGIPADTREFIWRDCGNGMEKRPNPSY